MYIQYAIDYNSYSLLSLAGLNSLKCIRASVSSSLSKMLSLKNNNLSLILQRKKCSLYLLLGFTLIDEMTKLKCNHQYVLQ